MIHTLTVDLSGDAADGNAEAIVNVNGVQVQVGDVLDVAAVNADDDVDGFTFSGDFGANPQVSVSFINNTYVDIGDGQRDLYVDGLTYDGTAQLGDKYEARYDQTVNYQVAATAPVAERAAAFVGAIGVDVHLGDWNLSYGDAGLVAASLAYLGVSLVRDGLPSALTLPEYQAFGAAGVRFDLIMPSSSSDALLPGQIAVADALAPYVAAVEGPNEVDLDPSSSWDGQAGYGADAGYQQALWNAVQADPSLSGLPVYALTLGSGGSQGYAALGTLSADATDGNAHVYYPPGVEPALQMQYALGVSGISTPGLPTVITETNFPTATTLPDGVSDAVQASYDLDLLMDAAKQGVAATYLYELLDDTADPGNTSLEDHYGLFDADGAPKPAATAIHDLVAILADGGPDAMSFMPGSLPYAVSGLPASGDTLLLEQSSGLYDLVIWAEPQIWNASSGTAVAAVPRSVEVDLGGPAGIAVFDPLLSPSPVAQYGSAAEVSVAVTHHPLIVQITPH